MADVGTWDKIQQGVKEMERLLSKKQNNLAMIKARQTLEYMVKSLAEKACIVEGDMADMIDQLYEGRWIDKTTRDHYHKLRIIGNKAVHEGHDSSSDANLAYHILSMEFQTFAPRNRRPQNRTANAASPARPKADGSNRKRAKRRKSPVKDFMRIFIPIIIILLLIILIRMLIPKAPEENQPTQPQTTIAAPENPTDQPTIEPTIPSNETPAESPVETTAPPETTTAPRVYKTTETLNVRAEPSTTARILVQLAPDTEVNVMGIYDEKWTIINYDGQDAYVATAYLTQ
ncbi:MAG: DUF4145 domain-containing protein [Lachnospiraceae bacterium]|nr:DUF4145 domain-containing protein [Lachnospiraceae bacterium]